MTVKLTENIKGCKKILLNGKTDSLIQIILLIVILQMPFRTIYQQLILFSFLIISCAAQSPLKDEVHGKVIAVKDGDTIDILYEGQKLTVRFAHIDCPEKNQPYGQAAKKFVSDKCFGQEVTVVHRNEYDRNKRLIGEVITTTGENLNKSLVQQGLAWHFKKYSTNQEYADLETQARKQKIGLWSEPNPTPPWEWRKKK